MADPTLALAALLLADPGPDPGEAAQAKRTDDAVTFLPRDWPLEVPAKLTAWDAATQSASWVERTFDANGLRVDKARGLFGNPTFCPAKPVGNGLMPPDSFPVDVTLRRRCAVAGKGVVMEFDWACACAAAGSGGSGSGSGGAGGAVLVSCCPGAIPTTLTLTVHSPTCAAFDGLTCALAYGGSNWSGTFAAAGQTWTFTLSCSGGSWSALVAGTDPGCSAGIALTIFSCAPLQIGGTTAMGGCAACTGELDFTITE